MLMRPPFYGVQPIAALSAAGGAPPAYDPDADAYFAYAGALGDPRKTLISDLVAGIKSDLSLTNFSDGFDAFWIMANETTTAAGKNVAKNDHHLTAVNSPTFTTDRGYAGNGTTSYLATDYIMSTDAVVLNDNSASLGVYNRTSRATGGSCNIGGQSTNEFSIDCYWGSSYMTLLGAANGNAGPGNAQGFWVGSRTGASLESNYLNGTSYEDPNAATGALISVQLFIGALNQGGSPSQFNDDQHALAFVGKGFSAAHVALIHTRVETYMDAIGAGVV